MRPLRPDSFFLDHFLLRLINQRFGDRFVMLEQPG